MEVNEYRVESRLIIEDEVTFEEGEDVQIHLEDGQIFKGEIEDINLCDITIELQGIGESINIDFKDIEDIKRV